MTSQVINQKNFSRKLMSAKLFPPDQFIILLIKRKNQLSSLSKT